MAIDKNQQWSNLWSQKQLSLNIHICSSMSYVSEPNHFLAEIHFDSSPLHYVVGNFVQWIISNCLQIISSMCDIIESYIRETSYLC